jgi:hypothetical protein
VVLALLADGKDLKEIADELSIERHTAEYHWRVIKEFFPKAEGRRPVIIEMARKMGMLSHRWEFCWQALLNHDIAKALSMRAAHYSVRRAYRWWIGQNLEDRKTNETSLA